MPALVDTKRQAEVVWLGRVADRAAGLGSSHVQALELTFDGAAGEAHGGAVRASCARVSGLYPRRTPIRNVRQLSILSAEDLAKMAASLGLASLDPALLGATMVVRGIGDFTHVPPSSRLLAPSGASLTVDMENLPCSWTARAIEAAHPGLGARFKSAAKGRRGVTAWVEAEGPVSIGDRLRLFIPGQRPWREADTGVAG